jgi:uncharacterized protein with FMN-binding domain
MPTATPIPRQRKRHPARGARIVALVSSVAATVGVTAAMGFADDSGPGSTALAQAAANVGLSANGTNAISASGSSSSNGSTGLRNGTFTGTAVDNGYGNIQVQATINSGRLSAVSLLQQPSDRKSTRINRNAAPVLSSEAISAQSARIDMVSGATYTSEAYAVSLQAALDQAAGAAKAGSTAATGGAVGVSQAATPS